MQVGGDERLEFLDLKLKITYGTISLDVFSKRNNSFTYVLPFTCYPKRKINNVPKWITLRFRSIRNTLRSIRNADEKCDKRAEEYQKYLTARYYQPTRKQFDDVRDLSRSEARTTKAKSNEVRKVIFFTTYNPSLPNMDALVKQYLPFLHSDENLKVLAISCWCF